MDPIVGLLLEKGVFGIIAAIGFYLYFKEKKINQEYMQTCLKQQIEDTKAKVNLAVALEDVAETVKSFRTCVKEDLGTCREHVNKNMDYINKHIDEMRLEQAKEKGRREGAKSDV